MSPKIVISKKAETNVVRYDTNLYARLHASYNLGKDWDKHLIPSTVLESGLMPAGMRAVKQIGAYTVYIFEKPPRVVQCEYFYDAACMSEEMDHYRIPVPVPWTVYIALVLDGYLYNVYHYWRNSQLNGMKSSLWHPLVTNIYEEGRVCLPPNFDARKPKTVADIMHGSYRAVWETVFNLDMYVSEDAIEALENIAYAHSKAHPERFKGVTTDYDESEERLFPTFGHTLFDVVNQQYSSGHYASRKPKNGLDLDGEPALAKFMTVEDVLASVIDPGSASPIMTIHGKLSKSLGY